MTTMTMPAQTQAAETLSAGGKLTFCLPTVPISTDNHFRSSVTDRLAAMADVGGVNSFRSFARSWQRAAAFPEVLPRRPSFVLQAPDQQLAAGDAGDDVEFPRSYDTFDARAPFSEASPRLASPFAGSSNNNNNNSVADTHGRERESKPLDVEMAGALPSAFSPNSSIFGSSPYLATPSIIGSYGSYRSGYGTMGGPSLLRHRPSIIRTVAGEVEEERGEDDSAFGEEQPILVKEVKQGNKVVLAVDGQSTLPQSVFNSINALIGVGLLSLPLAFKMSGWIFGLGILTLTAAVTAHTANLLAKCMDYDVSLITYSDLAYVAFGTRARIIVSALFTLELIAACVALVILFSDSLALLLPGVASVNFWKCVCAAVTLLLNAMPLRWLSYTSIIGIFSTFCSKPMSENLARVLLTNEISRVRCHCRWHHQDGCSRLALAACVYTPPPQELAFPASGIRPHGQSVGCSLCVSLGKRILSL